MSRSLHTTDLLRHLICGWNTPYAARLTHADERADAQLPHRNRPPGSFSSGSILSSSARGIDHRSFRLCYRAVHIRNLNSRLPASIFCKSSRPDRGLVVLPLLYLYTTLWPDLLGMTVATAQQQLHALPTASRPRRTWAQTANAILFLAVFTFACLMINGSQLVLLLPLKLLPFRRARKLYYEGIRYTKGAFGALLGAQHAGSKSRQDRGLSPGSPHVPCSALEPMVRAH